MDISKRYAERGVSAGKADVHNAISNIDKGLFPKAFCKILPDVVAGREEYCSVMHADGAGTKASLAYAYWRETGDLSVWRGIAQDSVVMNTDDLLCVGAVGPAVLSSTIGRNKRLIPAEVLKALIEGTEELLSHLREVGLPIVSAGGETADLGDLVRTIVVDSTIVTTLPKAAVLNAGNIAAGDSIVAFASSGTCTYEPNWNSGIGSNGLTSARHDLFDRSVAAKYPETFDNSLSAEVTYVGPYRLTDAVPNCPLDAGKMVLSPTRTYAPIVIKALRELGSELHALIHCSGGGQSKVLHFLGNLRVVKDNLMEPPVVFREIQKHSGTSWREMYQVFNMGHRLEAYVPAHRTQALIDIAAEFGIAAQVVGWVDSAASPSVEIQLKHETFIYSPA